MSTMHKIRHSRENWKNKAVARADQSRDDRKTMSRQSHVIRKLQTKIKKLSDALNAERKRTSTPVIQSKPHLVYLALQLFIEVRLSFRGVSRVIKALAPLLGIQKAPCPQTVINWVIKLSLVRMSTGLPAAPTFTNDFTNGWMFMIDESIGHSGGKLLVIQAIRLDHYSIKSDYPGFVDVKNVGVAISASWTGEKISNFLSKVIAVTGRPSAYIKDGGGNLNKACKLLGDKLGSPVISDISHAAANLLKKVYGDHPDLEGFLSACGHSSTKLKQTFLSSLTPPKLRSKARFLNLHRPIAWAEKILGLSPKGRAANGSVLQKLRNSLETLPKYRHFIQNFLRDARPLLECQKILKTSGLSITSEAKCRETLKQLPVNSSIKIGMESWLDSHINIAKQLGVQNIGMIVSSDSLESLFGLAKSHGTGEIKDPNRMGLRIPALCSQITQEEARNVVLTPHEKLLKIQNTLPSLQADRLKIFNGKKDLEELSSDHSNLELIPRSKNRDNSPIIALNSDVYTKKAGHKIIPLQKTLQPPDLGKSGS